MTMISEMMTIREANRAATAPRHGPVAPGKFAVLLNGYLRHAQSDIDAARGEASHYMHTGYSVNIIKVTRDGLIDCGFSGWNWKPLANEVAA